MPLHIGSQAYMNGFDSIPFLWPTIKALPWLGVLYLLKVYFSGASNTSERNMHSKVVMVTGGTSGVGEAVVRDLASRGAQIVLLTQHTLSDPFIVDYIEDLREYTKNELITAEQVDLSSLHSIRQFATKWIDNAPVRRLDMVILCGNTLTPAGSKLQSTSEGIELNWQVNYLANFHLLSILSPALRAQPADRDVRILFGTCSSYIGGDLIHITEPESSKSEKPTTTPAKFSPSNAYATSKLALMSFAIAFQKHLNAHDRPDKAPMNSKVLLIDPGLCRTPGTRRWLTRGSLLGLLAYLLFYPLIWFVLKSPDMGSQSFLFAAMEERFARGDGGWFIKEVKERPGFLRQEVADEGAQAKLWEYSEKMVEEGEKRGKEARSKAQKTKEEAEERETAEKEVRDYREKVGKKDGQKKEGGRRSKRA
ncbi:hypothetical protein MBLNU230_g3060t1 [Neophaeotheca triangularis]